MARTSVRRGLASLGLAFVLSASPCSAATSSPRGAGLASTVISPCGSISVVDTAGWLPVDVPSLHKRLTMRIPKSLIRESSTQGAYWRDARRTLVITSKADFVPSSVDSVSCLPGPGKLGYSECEDLLAGVLFRLVSTFDLEDGMYHVCAVNGPETFLRKFHVAVQYQAMSPDSADQELFLAMFRTLRPQEKPKK